MSINAIIIDDEQLSIDVLEWEIQGLSHQIEIIGKSTDPKEGIKLIQELRPDVLFLDIEMPGMTGLEMLSKLETIDFNIIFTTAYDHYALDAIKNEALDYLLKPIQKEDLERAVLRHLSKSQDDIGLKIESIFNKIMHDDQGENIVIPTAEGLEFIKVDDILRCESSSNYTYIYMRNGGKMLVSKTLKDVEAMIQSEHFQRIHKSHLINFNCIKRYLKSEGGKIVLEDGSEVPISRTKKGDFLDQL